MTEPLFFKRPQGLSAGEIAALTGAELHGSADLGRRVSGIAPLDRAGPSDLSFIDNAKLVGLLAGTNAGICLAGSRFSERVPSRTTVLVAREPYRAFVTVARTLFPDALRPSAMSEVSGRGAGAMVDPSARLEVGVSVDAGAVVGPRAEIGSGTVIGANAVIGPDVRIGRDCVVGAGATLFHALLGDRVILHPGVHLGQDGFGYVPGQRGHLKVPQVGRVIVQDDVEIGAGTTIDRGASRDTMIGEGTKIDNLVQIGHNVTVGRHCLIAGQAGISGSVTLGDFVMLGGKAGLADHLTVGEGAQIGAHAGVMHDVPAGAQWIGAPAQPVKEFFREVAVLRRLARGKPASRKSDTPDHSE
jgi:UDP-3-O-[3-hydroxymyristoyl] glucosamine N-acyltransferase